MKVENARTIARQLGVEDNEVIKSYLEDEEQLEKWDQARFIQVIHHHAIVSLMERVGGLEAIMGMAEPIEPIKLIEPVE